MVLKWWLVIAQERGKEVEECFAVGCDLRHCLWACSWHSLWLDSFLLFFSSLSMILIADAFNFIACSEL